MVEDDPEEFDTSGSFDLGEWLALWSYEKIHALATGFMFASLGAFLESAYILAVGLGILAWALGIRSSPYRETKSGDKKPKDSDGNLALGAALGEDGPVDPDNIEVDSDGNPSIAERTRDGRSSGLSAQILAEIRHKPHYFGSGLVIGDRVGYGLRWWVYGQPPEHYQHLSAMLEFIVF